jgi:hypothetical protein
VELTECGYLKVDERLETTATGVFENLYRIKVRRAKKSPAPVRGPGFFMFGVSLMVQQVRRLRIWC